ncbi:MAG TPA: dTDP-4-dehydrorhamnose reductase [Solirubrobacteraceae bacterium]|nr:dTDP-4-dehydrorhamnose reductase [Solirubrobacteraceae bacterium]
MPMRLLITGAAGMLGQDVAAAAAAAGYDCIALSRGELDITDPGEVRAAVRDAAPEVVVNCAAWTDVDGAETSEGAAAAVNGAGAGYVAQAAGEAGAWAIHISSDYVFNGAKTTPYLEADLTDPLSAYGRSKLAGEVAVAAAAPESHTIVRSSWLFGIHGRCFPATILRLAAVRDELSVVDDQTGCPTFTGHLALAILELCTTRPVGVLHVASAGFCSWYALAREIVSSAGLDCEINPSTTAEQNRPAPRPAYSVLRSERPEAPRLPPWQQGLEDYMRVGLRS